MWKKQTAATLAICFFTISLESNRTPRSRTTSDGLILLPVPTVSEWSCDDSLLMAALDLIHIASVLSAFSCNRCELHHCFTSTMQSLSCCRCLKYGNKGLDDTINDSDTSYHDTRSSTVTEKLHLASCLSVVSFNSMTPRAQSIIVYLGFRFTKA